MDNYLNTQPEKKELNDLLTFLLVLMVIGGVIKSIASAISFYGLLEEGSKYLAYLPLIGTIINAFIIVYFILYKKSIVGVWLFFGMCIISFIISISMDESNFGTAIGLCLGQIIIFSLLLLLRRNGESAWKTLNRKDLPINIKENQSLNESYDQAINPIWPIITYILTGIVIILMIIAIIASL